MPKLSGFLFIAGLALILFGFLMPGTDSTTRLGAFGMGCVSVTLAIAVWADKVNGSRGGS